MVEALAQFRFDELGHPQIQSDSIKPVLAPIERPHKLLILPVRFVDKGYDRFAGDPAQDDKNRAYFQDLLFTGGPADPEPGTLSTTTGTSRAVATTSPAIFSALLKFVWVTVPTGPGVDVAGCWCNRA